MLTKRLNDPTAVAREAIVEALEQDHRPVIQFSHADYTPRLLKQVNQLCAEFGDRIEVRFYGHYGSSFDAAVLAHLPDVRGLSLNCLTAIDNTREISKLSLTRLSFGVYRLDDPSFLAQLDFASLANLALSETAKRNFDLAPLGAAVRLERLFIQGHATNIEAIAVLPRLEALTLSCFPSKQNLGFLNRLASLRSLDLVLGGRTSTDELDHAGLEELSIGRVRGFESLGAIRRFPKLAKLRIEDQLQLRAIDLGGAPLHTLQIRNCKNLARIDGLETLDSLVELRIALTKLDLDDLMTRDWPDTLSVVSLNSGRERWNQKARAYLDARGYREHASRSPQPV